MEGWHRRSRPARCFASLQKTEFEGYRQLTVEEREVLAIVKDGVGVQQAEGGR